MSHTDQESGIFASTPRSRVEDAGPVRQLNVTDSGFLYLDAPNAPTALGMVLTYLPVPGEDADTRFDRLKSHFARSVNSLPGYHRAIVRAPFDVDNAWFVDGVDLDLNHHVRRHTLPAPGNSAQRGDAYADLFSKPMDLERPLWEIHVFDNLNAVEGLPENSFAVIYKFHHASFDGGTVHRLIEQLHSTSPERDTSIPPHYESIATPHSPSVGSALRSSAVRHARLVFAAGRLIASRVAERTARRPHSDKADADRKRALPVPRKTPFNNVDAASKRHFAYISLDFNDIRQIRKCLPGMTVNDVYHAVVGGSVRRYLAERGALPMESLVTICTVSTRSEENRDAGGNDATAMRLPLGTNEPDPLRRLQIIHDASIAAKAKVKTAVEARTSGVDLSPLIPAPLVASTLSLMRLARFTAWMPAKFNMFTVNVPGPGQTLYLDGAELVDFAGAPPIIAGAGLVVKATSYNNAFTIAVHASVDAVPDIDVLLNYMKDSFAELRDSVK